MKNIAKFLGVVFVWFLASVSANAQMNTLIQTTLAASVSTTAKTVTVTSATGIVGVSGVTPGSRIFLDSELMSVKSVSGNVLTVTRVPTAVATHNAGIVVWAGPANWFFSYPPPLGDCTLGSLYVSPWIDASGGRIYSCSSAGLWSVGGWDAKYPGNRTAVTGNYTVLPTDFLIAYTTVSTSGQSVTIPAASEMPGDYLIVKDESGSAASGATITITGTVNGSTSYVCVNSAYALCKLYSNGTAWFTM